jgi:hypothetical protein
VQRRSVVNSVTHVTDDVPGLLEGIHASRFFRGQRKRFFKFGGSHLGGVLSEVYSSLS